MTRSLVPTPAQLAWQRRGLGMFVHFGLNTFADREWSDGTLSPDLFDPEHLDADQWAEVAAGLGATYVVLTAKHHDGFCLWPTATTDYSVASAPWKNGQGDVVAELAAACRRRGLALGLYLSPWDRHSPSYDDPAAYDDVYVAQLTELCTRYGELVEMWFDGAGSEGRVYDWARFMDVVRTTQPGAMVFNMGEPTIRWVGNEDGLATDPVRYVVDRTADNQYVESATALTTEAYLPPECDVSLRRKWFWSPGDEPKTVEHLLGIFYRSVGLGANLLLNVPPDTSGRISEADGARLVGFRTELDRRLGNPLATTLEVDSDHVTARWDRSVPLEHLELEEDLSAGQRVTSHTVRIDGRTVAEGGTIGIRRIHGIPRTTAHELTVDLNGDGGALRSVTVRTGGDGSSPPEIPAGYEAPTEAPEDLERPRSPEVR
ncbi:alpha-L-fucosidase [Mycetocola sp. CAN_C7]|uniref:alpha-L-fucosidase n=1 Tax=Mycetocola sp. CAN_C7 TaxID=2787724 RepID=UPI0018CAE9FA